MVGFTRFILRHKLMVVLFWVVVTVFAVATVSKATSALSFDFSAPSKIVQTLYRCFDHVEYFFEMHERHCG